MVAEIKPGISTFASSSVNSTAVEKYLKPLIDYAISKIPAAQQSSTPIYLFATAGIRGVYLPYAENLYAVVRRYLATTPFVFSPSWATTLSGDEEGTYGWDAINMLRQTLALPGGESWGAFDMGGATTQITFLLFLNSLINGWPTSPIL